MRCQVSIMSATDGSVPPASAGFSQAIRPVSHMASPLGAGISPAAVMMVTPVAKVPSALRKSLGSIGELSLARNAPLALRVRGNADLAMANGFLEPGGRRAGGQLTVDGRIDGESGRFVGTV